MDIEILQTCFTTIWRGLPYTLFLIIWALPLSLILAFILAWMRVSKNVFLRTSARWFSAFFRGTPLLVLLYLAYNGTGNLEFVRNNSVLWWLFSDGARCAILIITLNSAAYISEILRGGLEAVPRGLREAALATGMTRFLSFRRIELPLAIRQALPAYSNEVMLLVKGTSLASTIAVSEMMSFTKRLFSNTLAPLEVFIAAGCFYLTINFVLIAGVKLLEWRLMRHKRSG